MRQSGSRRAGAGEVGAAFIKLGVTSFGGPIAHVDYFRREFVERRRWLEEQRFGQLLALCQFLPGPTSSQLGFSLGLLRAGWLGALAAFIGFTLPSALVMFALAEGSDYILAPWGGVLVHALKLVAVAVVAHGVLGMARSLTPDAPRALLAASAASLMIVSGNAWMQLVVIAAGAALGGWLCRTAMTVPGERFVLRFGWRTGGALLAAFGGLLILALLAAPRGPPLGQVAGAFYRAAALYDPVWISAVHDGWDFAFALVGFALLAGARWPAWTVVAWCVCACLLRSQLSDSWSSLRFPYAEAKHPSSLQK